MTRYVTVEPDLLYDGIRVLDGGKLTFDESGTLVDPSQILDDVSTTHLRFRNKAIVPGFVNSHSHAFQRLIRGRTHEKAALREDFWSWRQMMMTAVSQLTPEELYQVTYLALSKCCWRDTQRLANFTIFTANRTVAPMMNPTISAKLSSKPPSTREFGSCCYVPQPAVRGLPTRPQKEDNDGLLNRTQSRYSMTWSVYKIT